MKTLKALTAIATIIMPVSICACAVSHKKESDCDSRKTTRHIERIGSFTSISTEVVADIYCRYNPDSTGYAVTYARDEDYSRINFNNRNGKLTVHYNRTQDRSCPVKIILYTKNLSRITNGSVGDLHITGNRCISSGSQVSVSNNSVGSLYINADINVTDLNISNRAVGDLRIRGDINAGDIELTNAGVGDIKTDGSISGRRLSIFNNGTGDMTLGDNISARTVTISDAAVGNLNINGNIEADDLMTIDNESVGDIHVSSLKAGRLNINVSGSGNTTLDIDVHGKVTLNSSLIGDLTIRGVAGNIDIEHSGIGNLNIKGLKTRL